VVTIAIDNSDLIKTLIERRQKLQALSKLLPDGTDMTNMTLVESSVMEASRASSSNSTSWMARCYRFLISSVCKQQSMDPTAIWGDICQLENRVRVLAQKEYHAVAVFVTFDSERCQRNALHALSTGKLEIWRNKFHRYQQSRRLQKGGQLQIRESNHSSSLWDFRQAVQEERTIQLDIITAAASNESCCCSRALLFRGERVLRIKEAVEPSDVRWVDLQDSPRQRLELHLASAVGMMVFVMWSGYFIYRLSKNYPGHYAAIFITMVSQTLWENYLWWVSGFLLGSRFMALQFNCQFFHASTNTIRFIGFIGRRTPSFLLCAN